MSWWSRLLGGKSRDPHGKHRVDYLSEAIALERQGDFDAALTSYRLALRDRPNDPAILQNIAIAYSKAGRLEDAIRAYRRALDAAASTGSARDDGRTADGAHYGLAFLLLKRGDRAGAMSHLESFLSSGAARASNDAEMERWVRHARQTLDDLLEGRTPMPSSPSAPQAPPFSPRQR